MINDYTARAIVDAIIEDLSGRKGLGDGWFDTDGDIQDEMLETWEKIVRAVLLA